MQIFNTIIPIFSVIFLGWLARRNGFIPQGFAGPANRLVFYFAIPAMVFAAIAKGSLKTDFHPLVMGCTLAAVGTSFALTWLLGCVFQVPHRCRGTFVQSGYHGNLGYIGLAVAYYYLDQTGFISASLLLGFIMIFQNLLSVFILILYGGKDSVGKSIGKMVSKILGNPMVLSAGAGIAFSLTGIALPMVVSRTLDIFSGMALPLALLLIGATLNFDLMKSQLARVLPVSAIKLGLLPAVGLMFYTLWGLPANLYLPGLILLATPSATVSYVMAVEMNGDVEFAATTISVSTLLSALSFSAWLHLV
jgi:predicted permease